MALAVRRGPRRGWILIRSTKTINIGDVVEAIRTVRTSVEPRMVPMLVDAPGARPDQRCGRDQAVAAVQAAVRMGGTSGMSPVSRHSRGRRFGL